MNFGSLIRRALSSFGKSRRGGVRRSPTTSHRHQSAEAQLAKGAARVVKKKL